MLKVALVGTACTGKTTVLNKLNQKLQYLGFVFVQEAAKEYITQHKPISMFEHQVNVGIQQLILDKEREAESLGWAVICDRSALCPAVYSLAFGHEEGYYDLLSRVEQHIKTYDQFMVMDPFEVPYIKTNLRHEDELVRLQIHESYVKVLNDLKLPWRLVKGSEANRVLFIQQYLERRLINREKEL